MYWNTPTDLIFFAILLRTNVFKYLLLAISLLTEYLYLKNPYWRICFVIISLLKECFYSWYFYWLNILYYNIPIISLLAECFLRNILADWMYLRSHIYWQHVFSANIFTEYLALLISLLTVCIYCDILTDGIFCTGLSLLFE